ncbi:MAG: oligosaccharide flippase family protein [Planctomycetaceae bacterium]|nr:oligosaccharide flippase family protein [Planctomycetaceae bacterium]
MNKGFLAIFIAKLFFLASGYALYIGLGNILSLEQFGLYGIVFGVVSLVNMVLVNGSLQTTSHFVAASPEAGFSTRRRILLFQCFFAGTLLAAAFLLAPAISNWLNDADLTRHFRLALLITGTYAFYAVNVGYLNGKQHFVHQASLDITFATMKVSFILLAAYFGYGIDGIITGFIAAAGAILLISVFVVRQASHTTSTSTLNGSSFLSYAVSVMAVAFSINLILTLDLLLLKRLISPVDANRLTGLYTAAQSIARIPFYLLTTAALVIFPAISKLRDHEPDSLKNRADTAAKALSIVFGLTAGMAAIVIPIAERVVLILYPNQYSESGSILACLMLAILFITILNISVTMFSAAGRPRVSIAILAFTLLLQVICGTVMIPSYGAWGAAIATTISSGLGSVFALVIMKKWFKSGLSLYLSVYVVLCCLISFSLSILFDRLAPEESRILTLGYLSISYAIYLGLLGIGGVLFGIGYPDRVLLVTKPIEPPFNDGAKVLASGLIKRLNPSQIAICGTVSDAEKLGLDRQLKVYPVYRNTMTFLPRFLQNLRMFAFVTLFRYQFRAVHFFFAPHKKACSAMRLLKSITFGVPFIQTVLSRPQSFENPQSLIFGDIVTTGSEFTARNLTQGNLKAEVIPAGIELPEHEDYRSRADLLEQLKLKESEFHLLFAGDIDKGGALPNLKLIIPSVLTTVKHLRFHFSIRCKNETTESIARNFIKAFMEEFPSRISVYVDSEKFDDLIAMQDAMIFPAEDLYTKLDAPLVVLETMALGKPAFMLDREPLSELVPTALKEEILASTPNQLADKVANYALGLNECPTVALKEHIKTNYNIDRIAKKYGAIYDHLRI